MKNARLLVIGVLLLSCLAIPATAVAVTTTSVLDSITKVNDGVSWRTMLSLKARDDGKYGYIGNGIIANKTCYGLVVQSVGSFNFISSNPRRPWDAGQRVFDVAYIGNNRSTIAASESFTPPSGYLIHVIKSDVTGMMQVTKTSACRWAYIPMWGCFPTWDRY